MVIIGVDSHKRTHTVVAVDPNGQKLAERTVAATDEGHLELVTWSRRWSERTWAIEDCRHVTRRLEAELLKAGEAVLRVPPKLMAGARQSAREPGKSDPIDALAVARAALREPNLPPARLDGVERELRVLVDHRDVLIAERTRHQARLRWVLVGLGVPEPAPRTLARPAVLAAVDAALAARPELSARIGRDLVARIAELTVAIVALAQEIRDRTIARRRRSWRSTAAGTSRPPSLSPRPRASDASVRGPPSPTTTARRPSRSRPATPAAIG
jgi:transposase